MEAVKPRSLTVCAALSPGLCAGGWYIFGMAKERKSPQQKKEMEYTKDHFTPGWHSSRMFPRTWKRKKTRVNRVYRRKSDELLAPAKPGIAADVELIADDLTAARFQKSVSRKRLRKVGTITVGEKVKRKLDNREEAVGRKVRRHQQYDRAATSAVSTLCALDGEKLVDVVRHADLLCNGRNADELKRVLGSHDPVDRALHFLYSLASGFAFEKYALRRNPELDKALENWIVKANRIFDREKRARERALAQKQTTRKKLKVLRNR